MSELGHFLKEARQEKQLSLDHIQEITKIRKRYLEAIESGDYSVLPGQFYARAFIKSYAEVLGLQANDVLTQFAHEVPQIEKAQAETLPGKRTKEVSTASPILNKWISKLVLYAFIFLVLFVTYLAFVKYFGPETDEFMGPDQQSHGATGDGNIGSEDDATDSKESNNDAKTDSEGIQEDSEDEHTDDTTKTVEPPKPELTRISQDADSPTFEYTNAETIEMMLKADKGDIWFRIIDLSTNKTIDELYLKKGNEKSWDLSTYQEVDFHLGNLSNHTLYLNGEAVDFSYIEKPGTSYHVIFKFIPPNE